MKKKKFEFSKLILFIYGLVELGVIAFACYMMAITGDLTPLAYLIPSTAFVGAIAVKHYYAKAKLENKIKLMSAYGVEPTESSFESYEQY